MRVFSLKKSLFLLCAVGVGLIGCKPLEAPVEQVQRAQFVTKSVPENAKPVEKVSVAKNQTAMQFICKDDVVVKVQRSKARKVSKSKRKTSTVQAISVTYGNATHTLSPAVTQDGKKYSNIRWTWQETPDGKASLTDNSRNVLASECMLRP